MKLALFVLIFSLTNQLNLNSQDLLWFGCNVSIPEDAFLTSGSNEATMALPPIRDAFANIKYYEAPYLYSTIGNSLSPLTNTLGRLNIFTGEEEEIKTYPLLGKVNFISSSSFCDQDSCYLLSRGTTFSPNEADSLFIATSDHKFDSLKEHNSAFFGKDRNRLAGLTKHKDRFYFVKADPRPFGVDSIINTIYSFHPERFGDFRREMDMMIGDSISNRMRNLNKFHPACDSTVFIFPAQIEKGSRKLGLLYIDIENKHIDTVQMEWLEGMECISPRFYSFDNMIPNAPTCTLFGSLDQDESSNTNYNGGYKSITPSDQPTIRITDDDVEIITNSGRLKSINIKIDDLISDKDSKLYLENNEHFNFTFENDDRTLVLTPKDKFDFDKVEEILRNVYYKNTSLNRPEHEVLITTSILLTTGQSLDLISEINVGLLNGLEDQNKYHIKIPSFVKNGNISIDLSSVSNDVDFMLFDKQGRILKKQLLQSSLKNNIEISNLPTNMYFISLRSVKSQSTQKILVIN